MSAMINDCGDDHFVRERAAANLQRVCPVSRSWLRRRPPFLIDYPLLYHTVQDSIQFLRSREGSRVVLKWYRLWNDGGTCAGWTWGRVCSEASHHATRQADSPDPHKPFYSSSAPFLLQTPTFLAKNVTLACPFRESTVNIPRYLALF